MVGVFEIVEITKIAIVFQQNFVCMYKKIMLINPDRYEPKTACFGLLLSTLFQIFVTTQKKSAGYIQDVYKNMHWKKW